MRHDQALASDNYKAEVIPAVWPATVTFGSMPVIAIERAANDRFMSISARAPSVISICSTASAISPRGMAI